MYRFFVPSAAIVLPAITVTDPAQIHHIKNTLRLKTGTTVIVFDENAQAYEAVIKRYTRAGLTLEVMKKTRRSDDTGMRLTVACALPKKAKMDEIVDKLTQLGVDRIIPLKTERVIVKWGSQKERLQHQRWQKIALGACQQSQRDSIPFIDEITAMDRLVSQLDQFDLKCIPHLKERSHHLVSLLARHNPRNCIVLIGPEGDFSEREVRLAMQHGCRAVTLGPRVLRVDTAAIAVASFCLLYAYR